MVPSALPSSGQRAIMQLGQWSQRPGSSARPYCISTGYWPSAQRKSVPAFEVTVISRAGSMKALAARTRAFASGVGIMRSMVSGGSTASSIRVPVRRICSCSFENSSCIVSITRSAAFSPASAAVLNASGVLPT